VTSRERVIAALDHRQPDRTPYHVGFTEPSRLAMAAWYGDPRFEEKLGNCLLMLSTEPEGAWREVRPDVWADEFGVAWDRSIDRDIGNVVNRQVTPQNLARYPFPDPAEPTRWTRYRGLAAAAGDRYVVANLGFSLFERAWTLAGMETVLAAMVEDPPFVRALLDRILDCNLAIIDRACAFPIDAMMFGDDWGQQRGLLMGPVLWREFIGPRVRAMYAAVKAAGKKVFIHSCGKVDSLFPDLIAAGLDCFNPFQPEVIDVEAAKRAHGDRLAFYGGISTQRTLPYGTTREVRDEVRRLIERVGRDGGLIASPAHDIPRDAKPENIAAMIEELQSQ
jgi:uroporphyrinogen decarboxylase